MIKTTVCINCHEEFVARNRRGTTPKFCSSRCRQQNYRKTRNAPEQARELKAGIAKVARPKTRNAPEQAGKPETVLTAKNLNLQAVPARLVTVPLRGGVCIVCDKTTYAIQAERLISVDAGTVSHAKAGLAVFVAPTAAKVWLDKNCAYRWTP